MESHGILKDQKSTNPEQARGLIGVIVNSRDKRYYSFTLRLFKSVNEIIKKSKCGSELSVMKLQLNFSVLVISAFDNSVFY